MDLERESQQSIIEKKPETERLHFLLLRSIYDKCTKQYEGKYHGPLFGINVFLEENEIREIEKLLEITSENIKKHTSFGQGEVLWKKLNNILAERREKFGGLEEEQYVIGDDSAKDISKERAKVGSYEDAPVINVPSKVRSDYIRQNRLLSVRDALRLYKAGQLKGTSASGFAEDLRELYSFF